MKCPCCRSKAVQAHAPDATGVYRTSGDCPACLFKWDLDLTPDELEIEVERWLMGHPIKVYMDGENLFLGV